MGNNIISYDDLEVRRDEVAKQLKKYKPRVGRKPNAQHVLEERLEELNSHMALQERNEKLRIRNRRLIEVVVEARNALKK